MSFLKSSLGKKYIMALTGLMLIGFVLAHMAGNLMVFCGPEALNAYAKKLHDLGAGLWLARIGLLVVFLLHIMTALDLTAQNRSARPVPYGKSNTIQASLASRTMVLTGLLILAFVIFHLLHFTLGVIGEGEIHLPDGSHDVYTMVTHSYKNIYIVVSYVVAQIILGLHLAHGASSVFQSLGLNNKRWITKTRFIGPALGALVAMGNSSMPLYFFFVQA